MANEFGELDARGGGERLLAPAGRSGLWHLTWLAAIALFALGDSALFAGALHLPRRFFIAPHAMLTFGLGWAYLRASGVALPRFVVRKWRVGLIGAAVVAVASLSAALSMPASAHAAGWRLPFDMAWSGVVYGAADATLLAILPVLMLSRAWSAAGLSTRPRSRIESGALALAASILVTVLFHLGFPEYTFTDITGAVFGNAVMALGYIATGSPLTPLLSHALLHTVAVYHAPGTTPLLPPH